MPCQSILRSASISLVLALVACGMPSDKTIDVSADDVEMNLAISTARQTLPAFWQVFESRSAGESDFALKVRIEDGRGVEHFWVTDIARESGVIWGEIGNDPNIVDSVKLGDRVQVAEPDISDWLYMRNGKMVGNFTIRPLLKEMPPEEAERLRSLLADPD